ncbi:DUF4245 domain-containing protein [Actinomadura verrucosospora]|uniref:DUF4245 domain-containing protein n=1 Tax=Actinomadura verrucosospora TaxID=46165 RepID=A0A7D3VT81_ACTVE|nr:DUF4245 domain-containing protein [Actinomadura verrucosospora]QKG22093.1 hypothetical protein ACTIVE_3731 [Actinomadura verrucosospora]
MTDKSPASAPEAAETASGSEQPAAGERPPAAQPPATEAPAAEQSAVEAPRADGETSAGAAAQDAAPSETAGEGAAAPQAAGRPVVKVSPAVYKRLTTGLGGFTMAMGACLLLVLAIFVITPRDNKEVLQTVDYSAQLWALRSDAPYTAYAPEGLPPHWRPTSSRLSGLDTGGKQPVAWHLGFVTPKGEYAAFELSNEKADQFVPRMATSSKPVGEQQVGGAAWTQYHRNDKKANTLARTLPDGVSLVVTGTASYEELAVLAGSLKPQPKQGAGPAPSASATQGS